MILYLILSIVFISLIITLLIIVLVKVNKMFDNKQRLMKIIIKSLIEYDVSITKNKKQYQNEIYLNYPLFNSDAISYNYGFDLNIDDNHATFNNLYCSRSSGKTSYTTFAGILVNMDCPTKYNFYLKSKNHSINHYRSKAVMINNRKYFLFMSKDDFKEKEDFINFDFTKMNINWDALEQTIRHMVNIPEKSGINIGVLPENLMFFYEPIYKDYCKTIRLPKEINMDFVNKSMEKLILEIEKMRKTLNYLKEIFNA